MKYSHLKTPSMKKARKRLRKDTPVIDYTKHANLTNIGEGRYYKITTYGCQANEADTETMRGIFESLGFEETRDETIADVILLNTCTIRENAENRVFGELGRLKQYKQKNPDLILGVCGCMPQDESITDRLYRRYPYVDLIFGTHNLHRLPEFIESALFEKARVVEVLSEEGSIVEHLPKKRLHHSKAYVNIMYGCDEFCTYCIVPYTRGKERSRSPEHILSEIDDLIEAGYKEVTLLGQNVNAYGRDFTDRDYGFADLLKAMHATSIDRVRFTTSHPNDFDDAAIDVLARGGNMMPHIHLPVQSGSDKVLKRMNRKYTKASFLDLVQRIRNKIPDVSITTDLIVGFPGEDEDDFLETLDLVQQAGFEGAFTFIFSPRQGTPAARYEDNTPYEVKHERLERLIKLINKGFQMGHDRFNGQVVNVLVDGYSKSDDTMLAGYTPHHKLVHFPGGDELIGSIIPVRITETKAFYMKGNPDV